MKRPTSVRMPVWKGFRPGKQDEASTGEIAVDFHGSRLTERQLAAVPAAVKRAKTLQPKLLDALLAAYPKLEKHWENKKPKTMTKAQLKKNFKLWEILVTTDHHEDVAYVAYEFENSWHPSGTIVLTHGDRVVSVGDSEVLSYPHVDPLREAPVAKPPSAAMLRKVRAISEKRAAKNPKTLRGSEFEIHLPVWAGFVSRPHDAPSKGEALVSVGGDEEDVAVGSAQQAAYAYVLKNAAKMQKAILGAIAAALPKLARNCDFPLPKKPDAAFLATAVELTSITIHRVAKDGIALVGFQLACAWDREHALGVLTFRDRVLETGGADTAFLGWVAERAAKKR